MILTGAFLAEQAATIDNKLNVAGGVLSKFTVGPDRSASFVLVVLTRAGNDSSEDRQVEVELIPPTGEAPTMQRFEVPEASIGELPGFAFFGLDALLPVDGRWVIVVTGGGEAITLPLLIDTWTPPQSLGI